MSHSPRRAVRGVLAATAVVALVSLFPARAAFADPPVADDASETVEQLSELNHRAEALTEKWHRAKDRLEARRAELDRARADKAAAAASGEQARAVQGRFREQVDRLADATFRGARLNRLSALLVSESPAHFLDKMSALDALAADNREALNRLAAAVDQAEQARRAAATAAGRAAQAAQQAERLESDLATAREDMQRQIADVEQRLSELTAEERASYTSGGQTSLPIPVAGSGAAAEALRAALGKQGAPYSWGADGPASFDCSGLVYWAYQSAGIELPRSSSAQATAGSPVSRSQLQPGDLIALYSPVSHVGLYVGGGRYVHAPQPGDVVEVDDVPWEDVTAMRRIG